jgi:hypothetical protein
MAARTAKQRAALRKAQLASARKRRKNYRAGKKSIKRQYKGARKKWKNNPRVRSHTKAVYKGAAVGTLVGGVGLGTNIGAMVGSHVNQKKFGKLPTHPRGKYRGLQKAHKAKYKKAKKRRR